jgi:hypothetical protein
MPVTLTDLLVRVEFLGPQVHPFQALLPGQVLLGERRPLVGDVRLVPDDRDLTFVTFLAQAGSCLSRSMSGSHDNHPSHLLSSLVLLLALARRPVPTGGASY